MKGTLRHLTAGLLMLAVCLSMGLTAFAQGGKGGGKGDGSGGGANGPLELVSSTLTDGMKDVEPQLRVVLEFSKNVADLSVRENNERAISLTREDGSAVACEVIFPDENERRQQIEVQAALEPATGYVLRVDQTLMARNGQDFLNKAYTAAFTTAGDAPSASQPPALLYAVIPILIFLFLGVTLLNRKKSRS